jgi:peptidoglycan/xylan/chitin deacetylase (PgdA/CDA1 family)
MTDERDAPTLTIVTYHYVRPLEQTRFPRIKGRHLDEFERQLAWLLEHHTPVSVEDIVAATSGGRPLPSDAALLTFDDGYVDHYAYVFPRLREAGVYGAFFPPASAVLRGELLDANRVHFVLASVEDAASLVSCIERRIRELQGEFDLQDPEAYAAEWMKPSRFDVAEAVYVKRLLQTALPAPVRKKIASELFAEHVGIDERAFARELYVNVEQLLTMQASGMHIGSHGDRHLWLNRLERSEVERDIDASLEFLEALDGPIRSHWVMCYPYGGWNDTVLDVLRARNCTLGVTTESRVARIGSDDPLLLPRFDTNELPH